ncbi:MAG: hypothetical protein EA412_04460 [Chitinophagaceae bacterium]|nr:MAG: hypothetical protein EA412_04460 [Chitinophagaceae bacterium]
MKDNNKDEFSGTSPFYDVESYINKGKREYQEDHCDWDFNYLIVADGVGGLAKGNVASKLVVTHTAEFIESGLPAIEDINHWANELVNHISDALNRYVANYNEASGMGSTMVLAVKISEYLVVIHVGDSRLYHISELGEIKWKTKDHSLVQELVDAEMITEEQAATHPRKNVITRVLQATDKAPSKPTVNILENFSKGDRLFLCSDGVVESWTNSGLEAIMGNPELTNSDIIKEIKNYAAKNSSDNNTAILANIGWDFVPIPANLTSMDLAATSSATGLGSTRTESKEKNLKNESSPSKLNKKTYKAFILLSLFAAIVFGVYWGSSFLSSDTDEKNESKIEAVENENDSDAETTTKTYSENENGSDSETTTETDSENENDSDAETTTKTDSENDHDSNLDMSDEPDPKNENPLDSATVHETGPRIESDTTLNSGNNNGS